MEINLNRLSQADLAAIFGKTDRTITRWHHYGLPQHGRGPGCYYVWAEVLPWYVAFVAAGPEAKAGMATPAPRPGPNYFTALDLLDRAQEVLRTEAGSAFKPPRKRRKRAWLKLKPRKPVPNLT